MPLHLKTGDGDLLLIKEPALLTRCACISHEIYRPALHTHISEIAQLISRSKETYQRCPTAFINNSLNTELLHYIFQQREDKIAVFEVMLNI